MKGSAKSSFIEKGTDVCISLAALVGVCIIWPPNAESTSRLAWLGETDPSEDEKSFFESFSLNKRQVAAAGWTKLSDARV